MNAKELEKLIRKDVDESLWYSESLVQCLLDFAKNSTAEAVVIDGELHWAPPTPLVSKQEAEA